MSERLRHLIRGFFSNMKFSNRLWLTYNRLFRREARAITYIWKNRFYIVCDCAHGDHISVQEVLAERSYDQFIQAAMGTREQVRYVNVGANVGAFDLMLFDRGFRIESGIAVELNPYTFQRCLVNIQTNNVPNVKVLNCGVADTDTFIDFVPSMSSLGDNIFSTPGTGSSPTGSRAQKVELVSLSTLLQRHGDEIEEVDLLKLDCEGAEYLILESTPVELLQKFRAVLIEFHQEPSSGALSRAYEKLSSAGFSSFLGKAQKPNFVDLFTRK